MERYCINPDCPYPPNSEGVEECQACNTPLRINNRYLLIDDFGDKKQIFKAVDCQCDSNTTEYYKVIKVVKATHSEEVEQLKREAAILGSLNLKPYGRIPHVKDDCFFVETCDSPLYCLVMEFIDGQNLEQWLSSRGNPIYEERARSWLKEMAEILERVHGEDIVHRDINPFNIMLRNNRLVLIDFGIATVEGQGLNGKGIGTPGYMAPEQEQEDGRICPQTDLYALGRTFVYLLTGKHPTEFEEDSQTKQLMWRESTLPNISDQLKDLIDVLMAPSPQNRPKAEDILRFLQAQLPPSGQDLSERIERDRNRIIQPLYKPLLLLLVSLLISLISPWVLTTVRNIMSNRPEISPNHWTAKFFSNPNLEGNPVIVRDWGDSNKGFSYSWKSSPPYPILPDKYSAKITTTKRYFAPGIYLIKAQADDGIRVRIGEQEQDVINTWKKNQVDDFHCNFFRSEGGEYPIEVDYNNTDGGGNIEFDDIQPYKSYEESVSASMCKFEEPVKPSLEWSSAFFRWDKNQREPSVTFDKNNANRIGGFNLGSNQRSDLKPGIDQNWGTGSPKGHLGIPADFFVVRSYTEADLEKGKTYRARIKASGGFQLLAQPTKNTDPNKWVYFTPKDKWQYTDGGYKEIEFKVPNDGKYDFHFHLYKATGNAYIDLFWE